jgi:pimeloyl-ACP methyl ester carboxylesterase
MHVLRSLLNVNAVKRSLNLTSEQVGSGVGELTKHHRPDRMKFLKADEAPEKTGQDPRHGAIKGGLLVRRTLLALGIVGATVAGSRSAKAQDSADTPPLPPPGRFVDLGGWRLHLNCTGVVRPGQPTVILEAGLGDFSVEWSLVQPAVAGFARVCSYDRAGDGWSDIGPSPRTLHQIIYELHTLLDRAGERQPYMLVGYSYGGRLAQLYRSSYASDVVGMVLVEPGADDPKRMTADGRVVRSSSLTTGRPIPAVKTSGPLLVESIPPQALAQIRAGLADGRQHANDPPRDKLPADAQSMRTWALGRVGHVLAAVNPFESEELAALRTREQNDRRSLDTLPLLVIARGRADESVPDAAAVEMEH